MTTRAAIGVFGILAIILALFVVYGCGGGGSTPAAGTEAAALLGEGGGASGALGDGGLAGDGNPGDAPNDVAPGPTDAAPQTDLAPDRDGNVEGMRHHRRFRSGHPIIGVITAIEDRVMVLKPEVPEFIAERIREHMADSDRPADFPWPPELPAEIRLRLTADTVFRVGGEKVDGMPFVVRDKVVAWPGVSEEFDMRIARVVSDYSTFQERWQAMHDGHGDRPQWDGQPPHFGGAMPGWGEITAITDSSITISPEVPERIRERIREHHDGLPFDLPESMTFLIDANTKFFSDGEAARPGAFVVGDKVFIMPRRQGDDAAETDAPVAAFVSDGTWFMRHHEQDGDGNFDGDTIRQRMRDRWHDGGGGGMMGDAA